MMSAELRAIHILHAVLVKQQSLTSLLQSDDTPLTKEICYGVLRWFHKLKAISNELLHKSLKERDQDIFILLLIGLYKILYMDIPNYATVNETVNCAKKLKKDWATGLLNKILRLFINKQTQILATVEQQSEAHFSHPDWLIDKLKAAWPEHYINLLNANNTRAPMSLRVNQQIIQRDDYLAKLNQQSIEASHTHSSVGIQLKLPKNVSVLPDFFAGHVSVQDESGQMVIPLLDLQPGLRVLDACAAPGSKTSHILESEKALTKLVAIDIDPQRLQKIKENINRLKLEHQNVQLVLADVLHTTQWWEGTPFDRILLDAPCSATGVIRRHPDVKVLRKIDDIKKQVQLQAHILKACWSLLKPGGKLIYTTCSVLPDENEQIIEAFIKSHKDASTEQIELPIGMQQKHGIQVLPQQNGPDGFYYAKLIKGSS